MSFRDDPEDVDPGLARERTRLAWIRTAISFAAVGAAILKVSVAAGATVLATAPFIWLTGLRMSTQAPSGEARTRLLLTALAVTAVGLVVLVVVLLGHGTSQGFHPPPHALAGANSPPVSVSAR
jgi:uncharacterized membrane protein YidH (DUF202 family)